MNQITISGYRPGAIGKLVELHGTYYSRHWNFGLQFETMVAAEMAEFHSRFNPAHDGFWLVLDGDRMSLQFPLMAAATKPKAHGCAGSSPTKLTQAKDWAIG